MKYLYLTITSITLAYLVINLFIYFYQRNLLYNPSENNYLNDKINFNYKEIFIEIDKNIKLAPVTDSAWPSFATCRIPARA